MTGKTLNSNPLDWRSRFRRFAALLLVGPCLVAVAGPGTSAWSQEAVPEAVPEAGESADVAPEPGDDATGDDEASSNATGDEVADFQAEMLALQEELRDDPEFGKRENAFNKAKAQLSVAILAQRSAYLRFQNSDEKTAEGRAAYRNARREAEVAMKTTYDASLDLLQLGPNGEAIQFMITMIENYEKNDIYDKKALIGSIVSIDGGRNELYFFLVAARSAIVNGDFKTARKVYEALDRKQFDDVDKGLFFGMDLLEEQYKAEQERIAEDVKNDNLPRVKFETTAGDFVVELFLNDVPSTVTNFIGLVEHEFYDGLDFVQVTKHQLALTGDPSSNGTGNSGNFLKDEFQGDETKRFAMRGSLVMAKIPMGEGKFVPNSGSCQFALLFLPNVFVTKQQTVFGRVIEGMEVVSRLRRVDPSEKKSKDKIEIPPDQIISATVIRRPDQLPEAVYVVQSNPALGSGKVSPPAEPEHDHNHDHDHDHGESGEHDHGDTPQG